MHREPKNYICNGNKNAHRIFSNVPWLIILNYCEYHTQCYRCNSRVDQKGYVYMYEEEVVVEK